MDENTLFRSALHGFKREDVMDYVTKTARQHEAALSQLQSELEAVQDQLAETCSARDAAQQSLRKIIGERDTLLAEKQDYDALQAQLNDAQAQIDALQLQLKESHERQVKEVEAVKNANQEALKQYQEDAGGYAVLAEKVGRIMLRAENTGEAIRIHAQEESDAVLQEAKLQAEAILASAREQADALIAEAQAKVSTAQADTDAIQAWTVELFQHGKQQFEATQHSVNEAVSRAMSEVDQLRSMLLDLSDSFCNAQVSFDTPTYDGPNPELLSTESSDCTGPVEDEFLSEEPDLAPAGE